MNTDPSDGLNDNIKNEIDFARAVTALMMAIKLDVSDTDTLFRLWREVGLPDDGFADREDPAFVEQIIGEHNESLELGVSGVPAVRLADSDVAIVGAQPIETYRRWIERRLAAEPDASVTAPA